MAKVPMILLPIFLHCLLSLCNFSAEKCFHSMLIFNTLFNNKKTNLLKSEEHKILE